MILQPAKVATPPVAASGLVVQASVPPGLVPMARVIELVAVGHHVARLRPRWRPRAGWSTLSPLAPPPGWVVKTSWVAVPTVMVNGVLVARGEPGGRCGQRVGARLAGDLAAGEGGRAAGGASGLVVQASVPPGLVPMARVIELVAV